MREANCGDIRSLWSGVRRALKYLNCTVKVSGMCTQLCHQYVTVEGQHRLAVQRLLAKAKSEKRLWQLQSAPDQGRAFHHLAKHPSSSHWIQAGAWILWIERGEKLTCLQSQVFIWLWKWSS